MITLKDRDKIIPRRADDQQVGGNLDPTYGMVYAAGCDSPKHLASGSYGRTFEVMFRKTQQTCALKLGSISFSEIAVQRAASHFAIGPEVLAAGADVSKTEDAKKIKLPPCVLYMESGNGFKVAEPVGFLVMEKMDYTLKRALDTPTSISSTGDHFKKFIALFRHCYNNNFTHGDLHPGNVMWSIENSHWKLIDFGFKPDFDKTVIPVVTQLQAPYPYRNFGHVGNHVMRSFRRFRTEFNPPRMSLKMFVCYEWWQLVNIYTLEMMAPDRWAPFVDGFNAFLKEHIRRAIMDSSIYSDVVVPNDYYVRNFAPFLWEKQQLEYKAEAEAAAKKKADEAAAAKRAQEEAAAIAAAQKKALEDAEIDRQNKMKIDEGLVQSVRAQIAGQATNSDASEAPGPMLTRQAKKQLLQAQKKIGEQKKQSLLVKALTKAAVVAQQSAEADAQAIADRTRSKEALSGFNFKAPPPKAKAKAGPSRAAEFAETIARAKQAELERIAAEKKAQEEEEKAVADAAAAEVAIAALPEPDKAVEREIQAEKVNVAQKRKRVASLEREEAMKALKAAEDAAEAFRYMAADAELKRRQKAQRLGASVVIMEAAAALGEKVKNIWEHLAAEGSELSNAASAVLSEAIETYVIADSIAQEESADVTEEDLPPPPPPDPEVVQIVAEIDETLVAAQKLKAAREAWTHSVLEKINAGRDPLLKLPVVKEYAEGDTAAKEAAYYITAQMMNQYMAGVEVENEYIQSFLLAFENAIYTIIMRVGNPRASDADAMFKQFFNDLGRDLFKKSEIAIAKPSSNNDDDEPNIVFSPLKPAPPPTTLAAAIEAKQKEDAVVPALVVDLGEPEKETVEAPIVAAAPAVASLVPPEAVVKWTATSKPKIGVASPSEFRSIPSMESKLPDSAAEDAEVKVAFLSSEEDAEKVGIAPAKFKQIVKQHEAALKIIPAQYEGPTYAYVQPPSERKVLFSQTETTKVVIPPFVPVEVPAAASSEESHNDAVLRGAASAEQISALMSEIDKAKRKARAHWRKHPRGEAQDKARLARNVVTRAADYIPGRNDFAGVDTP